MKKLFITMMLVVAVAVSGNIMAQDTKKATPEKPKTETKSEKKACCKDSTAKKDVNTTKTSGETKKVTPPPPPPVKK